MAGHVILWIVSAMVGLFCFSRAWKAGEGGLDNVGNVRDWLAFNRSEFWVAIGAALVLFSLVDIFLVFNPPPPALNGAPNR